MSTDRPFPAHEYDLVIGVNYYVPYVSGLTNVARDVAEGLAARGWRVLVVATQHEKHLPRHEVINGVRVVRTPVVARIGKGVISPSFVTTLAQASRRAAVVNLHAPMLEAGVVATLSKAPVVLTYQCDVSLPAGLVNQAQNRAMDLSTRLAARRSAVVTVSSIDYAEHSRVASSLLGGDVREVAPTCLQRGEGVARFRDGDGFHLGFLGRIVEEKGIEYLVRGFSAVKDPEARLLIAGDFAGIAGGSVIDRVKAAIADDERVRLQGFLPDEDLDDFYASIDAFALPSVNPFEAFGIVQVEAMMVGVPALASDMPGVRQPVLRTGMGVLVTPRDSDSVTRAIEELQTGTIDLRAGRTAAHEEYALDKVLDDFVGAFRAAAAK